MLNYGIIGAGNIFWTGHLPVLKTLPQARIMAVCDINTGILEKVKKEVGVEHTFEKWKKMADLKDIDVVIVSGPTVLNAEIVEYLAGRGKHIFLEKPLAITMADARRIVEVSKQYNVKICVGHQRRYSSVDSKAVSLIKEGRIGRIVFVQLGLCSSDACEWMKQGKGAYFNIRLWGGGLWIQWGVHYTDLLLYLTGSSAGWVSADIRSCVCPVEGFDDDATALISLKGGIIGIVMVSGIRDVGNMPKEMEGEKELVVIQGTEGTLIYGRTLGRMMLKNGKTECSESEAGETAVFNARRELHKKFINSIKEDKPSPVPVVEAANALALILAGYESAKNGRSITIDSNWHF